MEAGAVAGVSKALQTQKIGIEIIERTLGQSAEMASAVRNNIMSSEVDDYRATQGVGNTVNIIA